MIGCRLPSNDVYVFFEGDDLDRIANEKIRGHYFTAVDDGVLVASVNKNLKDLLQATIEDGIMILDIRNKVYQALCNQGYYTLHEGNRCVCLRESNSLDISDQIKYQDLSSLRANQ